MNIEERNKAACKTGAPGLYQALYQSPPQYPEIVLEQTPKGLKAQQQDITAYLGSSYCRAAEFEGMFAQTAADTEVIIFFGYLAKDLLRFLRKNFRNLAHLIIADPTSQILRAAFQVERLDELASELKNVSITIYANLEVDNLLQHITGAIKMKDKISAVFSVFYQTAFPAYCNSFAIEFKKRIKVNIINLKTYNYFTETWLNGIFENYQIRTVLVNEIQPIIAGRTVILVAAGPSLQKNVHLLKEADAQAVIIAVGSSVPILNKLGIRPHFNAGVDLFQGSGFSDLQIESIPLLFGNKINPATLAAYKGAKVCFIGETDALDLYLLGDKKAEVFVTDTGFSVAVSIASLVCKMGAKRLVFIGQDMCLYDNKLHYLKQDADDQASKTDRIELVDIYGNKVFSASGYWAIKGFLEGVISRNPEVEYINATEGGLGLIGARNARLSEVLAETPQLDHSIKEEIAHILKDADTFSFMDYFEEKKVMEDLDQFLVNCARISTVVENIGKLQKNKAQKKRIESELIIIEKQMKEIKENKLYETFTKVLYGMLEPIMIRYGADLESKDWERRVMARVKIAIGFTIPLKAFCELMQNLYYKYRPEKDEREQKEAVSQ